MPRKASSKSVPKKERGGFKHGGMPHQGYPMDSSCAEMACKHGGMAHKRGLGGDILGGLGNMFLPGVGGHLGRGVGDAIGSLFGFKHGGMPKKQMGCK